MMQKVCLSCTHVVETLKAVWGISMSRQLVHLIVRKRLNYTFKRTRKRGNYEPKRQAEDTSRFLHDFLRFEKAGKLAAVDECGFDQRCVPVYAYALRGKQAILKYVPNTTDRRRVTMIMGIEKRKKRSNVIAYSM